MIIEVRLEAEDEARRYRINRRGGDVVVRRAEESNGGAEMVVDWRMPEPRVYSLIVDGRSYDVHIDEDERDEEALTIHLLSQVLGASAADARKHRVARDAAGPEGVVRVTAPMPGRIAAVLVDPGAVVARGDGLLILEAMKMENEIRAPRAGTVTAIEVVEGAGVEGGALLATIE